jgi:methyl-accepting chemotaxis protein
MIQRFLPDLRLATKLPLMVVLLTLASMGGIGLLSMTKAKAALEASLETSMAIRAEVRAEAVAAWIDDRMTGLALLSREPDLIEALRQEASEAALARSTEAHTGASATAVRAAPVPSELAAYLREVRDARGLEDLLVLTTAGDLVHSIAQRSDLGTNLIDGPYAGSPLGEAFRAALSAVPGRVFLTDFASYIPAGGEPRSFMAVPVTSNGAVVGVLAAELAPEVLSGALEGDATAESGPLLYLIGRDGLLRTAALGPSRVDALEAPPEFAHVEAAAMGEVGFFLSTTSLLGEPAVAMVRPLGLNDVEWSLVEEVSRDEALASLSVLRRDILISMMVAAALSAGLGWSASRMVTRPLAMLAEATRAIAGKNYDYPIDGAGRHDELGELALALATVRDELAEADALAAEREAAQAEKDRVVSELGAALSRLAEGDLTYPVETSFAPEYERLRHDVNLTMANLNAMLSTVVENAARIGQKAQEISSSSDDLSRRTENQAATLEQTAAALDELTTSVRSSAVGAAEVDDVVNKARAEAEQSGGVVRDAVGAMSEIERSSNEIGQIIGVIDDIAFQTNLLALNAGVEAARAGEAGKGFAVVASEVRTLAQRSSDAAKQIKTLIGGSARHVRQGVDLVGRAGEALTSIVDRVAHISELVSDIATGAKEQATGLSEINVGVNQLDQVTQQNAAMVEQSTAASRSLHQEAKQLTEVVSRFRLLDAAPHVEEAAPIVQKAPPSRRATKLPRLEATSGRPAADAGWDEF